jgi:hypothetical protein
LLNQINTERLNMEARWYMDELYRDLEMRATIKEDMGLAAEGETPIMPPMGFGESVNWRPHEDRTPDRDRRRAETAYSMIEYQDDWCLREIAEKVKKEKHGLEWNEGHTEWDSDSDGNVILGIWDNDNNRLDKIIYDRKALAEALKSVGYENPESWGSETVRFNSVTDAYTMAYSQGHAHGRQQKTYDPKLSKEERNVFTEAWKAR